MAQYGAQDTEQAHLNASLAAALGNQARLRLGGGAVTVHQFWLVVPSVIWLL